MTKPTQHPTVLTTLVSLVFLCLFGCDTDSGIRQASSGHLVVSGVFAFPKTGPTENIIHWVEIKNSGPSPIAMTDFVAPRDDDLAPSWRTTNELVPSPTEEFTGLPRTLILEPKGVLHLALTFHPQQARTPRGTLSFRTNSVIESEQLVHLPISGLQAIGELHASDTRLLFGRVGIGTSAQRDTVITNMGTDTVFFEEIVPSDTDMFSIRINGIDPAQDPSILLDPDQDGNQGVAQDARFTISVIFEPETDQPVTAQLHILSNAVNQKLPIQLLGNGAGSCLQVVPGDARFPDTIIGEAQTLRLRIESCGDRQVTIEMIGLEDSAGVFDVLSQPDLPGTLPSHVGSGDRFPGTDVLLRFAPGEEQAYRGVLRIRSNDPLHPVLEIPVFGRGIINLCPRAIASRQLMEVHPLDMILLDGSESIDPDSATGRPAHYEWVVIERPEGSISQPVERFHQLSRPGDGGEPDAVSTPIARFFVDLAGEYVLALRVVDHYGASAPSSLCPQEKAHVRIRAIPSDRLHVQLVWNTPDDPDQSDERGTDIDLHLHHPLSANWFASDGSDCFYLNRRPDWGRLGHQADDPSLDIDDVNGAGPENINIEEPENTTDLGQPYRIGVHYFDASMAGLGEIGEPLESLVTVRVYVDGRFAFEARKTLYQTDDFWQVAEFHYDEDGGRLTEMGQVDSVGP
jgi:hypothetical protein